MPIAHAEDPVPAEPVYLFMSEIDNKKPAPREDIFKKRSIVYNLAHSAFFSDDLPDCLFGRVGFYACIGSRKPRAEFPYKEEERFKESYPYFYPLVFGETTDVPDFPAINKWVKPARISFAMTRKGENPFMEDVPRMPESLQKTITPLLPHISEAVSRINATLKPIIDKEALHFDADAYTYQEAEGQGRIHIMFFTDLSAYEIVKFIKRSKPVDIYYSGTRHDDKKPKIYLELDRHIPYPIPFTPKSERQVEGHFFINPKNEIQAAVCYIPAFVAQDIQAHLIDECLLRSMGIPDPVLAFEGLDNQPRFLLGYWHDLDKWTFQRKQRLEHGKLAGVSGITDVDLLLLKILYQPEVKTGMTMKQFFQLFNAVEPAAEAPATP